MGTNGDYRGLMGTKLHGDYGGTFGGHLVIEPNQNLIPHVSKGSHYLPPPHRKSNSICRM